MSDSSRNGSHFDPRFDPAFQPGYDPSVDARTDSHEQVRMHSSGNPDAPAIVPQPEPPQESRDTDERWPAALRHLNPFLVAIWALSALFIAAGLYLLRYMGERLESLNAAGGGSSADYFVLNSYATGAPMLVVLGLASATGSLFLLAQRRGWRSAD